jgi:hypothetical protein
VGHLDNRDRDAGVTSGRPPGFPRRVEDFLSEVPVLPFDVRADSGYCGIRAELEGAGRPPAGPNDLLIAAHACALAATMVTANASEFRRIPGLNVENWLEQARRRTARNGAAPASVGTTPTTSRPESRPDYPFGNVQ